MNYKRSNVENTQVIRTVGLMTGTSMDGLDISVADIGLRKNNADFNVIGTTSIPYPNDLEFQIRQSVYDTGKNTSTLDRDLGIWYADKLFDYLRSEAIDNIELIGSHGQTIHHVSGEIILTDRRSIFFSRKIQRTSNIGFSNC